MSYEIDMIQKWQMLDFTISVTLLGYYYFQLESKNFCTQLLIRRRSRDDRRQELNQIPWQNSIES